jgi:hypothetical protein
MSDFLAGGLAAVLAAAIAGGIALWEYSKNQNDRRLSLNRAVLAEIARLLAVLDGHYRFWSDAMDQGGARPPLIPFTMDVYRHAVADIGSMNPALVADVVRFFGYVRFINAFQRSHGRHVELGREAEFDMRYQEIVYTVLTDFGATFHEAFKDHPIPPPILTPNRPRPRRLQIQSPPGGDVEGRALP